MKLEDRNDESFYKIEALEVNDQSEIRIPQIPHAVLAIKSNLPNQRLEVF